MSHQILNVLISGAFSASQQVAHCISIRGDSEYELITEVKRTNQNTRNTIFVIENLINVYLSVYCIVGIKRIGVGVRLQCRN